MRRTVTIIGLILLAAALTTGGAYIYFASHLPRREDFSHIIDPRITHMQDATVLRVDFEGDANRVIAEAFDALFKVYYRLDGVERGMSAQPPLARYEGLAEVKDFSDSAKLKKIPWKGFVAIPVPAGTILPRGIGSARIETMPYGTVAEIVHFGSYESEHPTIQKLHHYIDQQGYVISGLHEEVYCLGPGMPIPVKPEEYITIVRYQIRKK
jgi:effector-binding domain-containing protein